MSGTSEIRLPTTAPEPESCPACEACPGRRDFLRVGLGTLALAVLAGALPREAAGVPVRAIRSRGAGNDLLRYPLPGADGVDVDKDHEVILVRYQGTIAAFALSCPHQRSMLRWREKDGRFQCTKHHSRYSPLGEYLEGRATRNMDRLGIHLDGAEVVVDPSTTYHSDEDPQGWASAVVAAP